MVTARQSQSFATAIGYLTLSLAVVLLVLFLANFRSRTYYHGPDYSLLGWMALYAAVTGLGLVRLQKWAIVLFAVPSFAAGGFLIVGSILKVPLPWMFLNITFGVLLCAPTVVMIRDWKHLGTARP